MTDSELVEAVARGVMGFVSHDGLAWREVNDDSYLWNPFHDANDLFMVLNQFDEYHIDYKDGEFMVVLWANGEGSNCL